MTSTPPSATPPTRPKPLWRRGWFQSLILLPVALGLLYLAFRQIDLVELRAQFSQANYIWVTLGALVGLVGFALRAARWQLLLHTPEHRVGFMTTFYSVAAGYFGNLLIPRAGEVIRCAEEARHEGIRFDVTLGTVVAERLCDLLFSLIVLLLAVLVSLRHFGVFLAERVLRPLASSWTLGDTWRMVAILFGIIALVIVAVVMVRREVFGARAKREIRRLGQGLAQGLRSLWTMRGKWAFLGLTILLWASYWLSTYLVTLALPATSGIGPLMAIPLLAVATFGMIIPVQGGIGSFHLAVALWLQFTGLSRAQGLTYATLSHTPQFLLILVLPFILYPFMRAAKRRHRAQEHPPEG